jgi:hypothetical protein
MKSSKSILLSGLNIVIYAIMFLLLIGITGVIVKFTDRVILNSDKLVHPIISDPIITPFNDVFLTLDANVLKDNNILHKKIERNTLIFKTIKNICFIVFLFLITIQLKILSISLRKETFFVQKNLSCVRKISYLLGVWVIIDFILYQSFQLFIPLDLVQENYNYIPINKNPFFSILFSIDYLKLLSAFAFYVITIVFKEGYHLKEQSDLTI